jgi:hypothetical protein
MSNIPAPWSWYGDELAEINARSPEQVARMEQKKGLRNA